MRFFGKLLGITAVLVFTLVMGLLLPSTVVLAASPVTFKPFSTPPNHQDVNLYRIEVSRFARSKPLIAPDFSGYVYSDVFFLPETRQTLSKLFFVPLPSTGLPKNPADARQLTSWFDPNQTLQRRQQLYAVGDVRIRHYAFDTLTPIDWTHDSTKLLIKRRAGIIYTGLRCSDIMVWDKQGGVLSVYAELVHALEYHWRKQENQQTWNAPEGVTNMAWDVEPLGWQTGSNTVFYWRGWAFTQQNGGGRYNLGIWQYNIQTQTTTLINPNGQVLPYDLASNGLLAVTNTSPAVATVSTKKKRRWQGFSTEALDTTLGKGVMPLKAPPPPMR